MADPVERLILLADPGSTPADQILALATGRDQQVLAKLTDTQASTMVKAWQQARTELAARMNQLYGASFGSGHAPTPAQVLEWTQKSEVLEAIQGKLDNLGITTQALQGQAFSAGAVAGMATANAQLAIAAGDFGGPAVLGKATYGSIDNVAQDLGMVAAVNDTKNLPGQLRAGVQQALQTGAIQGEGITKLSARLDEVLDGATTVAGSRADNIARWATVKGYNAATEDAMNDAANYIPGLQKMWLVQNDEQTCPYCMSHFGEVIPTDDEFDKTRTFTNGAPIKVYGDVLEYPPLHPKCRCTIISWVDRWRGLSTFTPEQLQAEARTSAEKLGFTSKTFDEPAPPATGLRATREGRRVLYTKAVDSIPAAVRQATEQKFLSCWAGGK